MVRSESRLGLLVGSGFRILEHYWWVKQEGKEETGGSLFYRSLVIVTQVLFVGVPSAYLLILFVVSYVQSQAVLGVVGWTAPILTSFVALDIRDMIRKIGPSNINIGGNPP